jgi:hypothetical protein
MSLSTSPLNGSSPVISRPPTPVTVLPDVPGLGGAIAGLVGGVAMMATAALLAGSLGRDVWLESRQIAAFFYGADAAASTSTGPVIVGTLIHLLMSALLGALFGIVSRRLLGLPSDYGTPVLVGMIYGLMIWMLAFFVILPALNPALLDTYQPSFIIQNLVYGMVTGLVYTKLRPAPYAAGEPARQPSATKAP